MGGLGELVLRGMRNSAIALAILTAGGCGTFRSDYAPLRPHDGAGDIKATIHYVFSPAREVGKLYLAVIGMWKEAFGKDVVIKPYCTPMPDNGVADELYCEKYPDRARDMIMEMVGKDVDVPAVLIEYGDGRSVKVNSDEELCLGLDRPPDCLDDLRARMYSDTDMGQVSRNRHSYSQLIR